MADSTADYKTLKADFDSQEKKSLLTLKRVQGVSTNLKTLADLCVSVPIITFPVFLPLLLLTPFALSVAGIAPLLPYVCASLGGVASVAALARFAKNRTAEQDNETVKSHRKEFNKASLAFTAKSLVSSGLIFLSGMAFGEAMHAGFGGGGSSEAYPAAVLLAGSGLGLGLWARGSRTRMNVYDAAIQKAQAPVNPAP